MAEKPILFNTEMVKAILDGRKTQTRRLCKGQPQDGVTSPELLGYNPPYQPGDILWVRETWNYGYFESSDKEVDNGRWFEPLPVDYSGSGYLKALSHFIYRADFTKAEEYEYGMENEKGERQHIAWRPSIHMPRQAARIFLKVKWVRAERLHDYFDASSAYAEGVMIDRLHSAQEAVDEFIRIWNGTIKKDDVPRYGWDANPWVWTIGFELLDGKRDCSLTNAAQYADQDVLMPAT